LPTLLDTHSSWGPPADVDKIELDCFGIDFNQAYEHLDKHGAVQDRNFKIGKICDFTLQGVRYQEQRAAKGKSKGAGGGSSDEKLIEKRAKWLNDNLYTKNPVDAEAVAAMQGMGCPRAMELLREIEEKHSRIQNPSAYLKSAARREGFGPPEEPTPLPKRATSGASRPEPPTTGPPKGKGKSTSGPSEKVRRRAVWLNNNVFAHSPLDDDALAALMKQDPIYALSVLKDLESKADSINHPSKFLIATLKTDGMLFSSGPPALVGKAKGKGGKHASPSQSVATLDYERIDKRAAWLNANVFWKNPIDEEAIAAMKGMGVARAMELFSEVEEKQSNLRSASGYLKTAAKRDGFGPPDGFGSSDGYGPPVSSGKVQKRAAWLNKHVFSGRPIDNDALEAMCSIDVGRAMDIFKEMEEKGSEVKNPGAYLMAAVRREQSGGQHRGVKRSSSAALSVKTEQVAHKPNAAKRAKLDVA